MRYINFVFSIILGLFITQISYGDIINEDEFERNSEVNASNTFITISLGCNCHPACFTRLYGIRFFASPFDWVATPYQALYKFIKNDFNDFFKKENLVAPSPEMNFSDAVQLLIADLKHISRNEYAGWILDKESGMFSIHDFPSHTHEAIDQCHELEYEKYQRRIKRFYNEINSGKHVYFIRYLNITKKEAYDLYQLIKLKFPKTSFTLIVIGNTAVEFDQDWGIFGIKNFFIDVEFVAGKPFEENLFWQKLCGYISSGSLL